MNSIQMICLCCDSIGISKYYINAEEYYRCNNCGLIFLKDSEKKENFDSLRRHYQKNDPYKEVSKSKNFFYDYALNYLSSRSKRNARKILDIGCGYGYFLKMASKRGWEPAGVEVVQDAVKSSQRKAGFNNIFFGKLKEACLSENSFDAISLWDVIAIVDNPSDELKECYRLLKSGGIIGIRTRNVLFQIYTYRLFNPIEKVALRFGFKKPYVLNKYCFSKKSLVALLSKLNFINIKIDNSPLTCGDPYNHMPYHYFVKVTKAFINFGSMIVSLITGGNWLIAPSLLIWAEKP